MSWYKPSTSSELVIPRANNCQPPQNKLRTESINSGDIHSIYDNTLLTGTNRIFTTPFDSWVSPKNATDSGGRIYKGNFVVNTDDTIVSAITSITDLQISNSSSSAGNDSFTPPAPVHAGVFSQGTSIIRHSSTGKILNYAGITGDFVNKPTLIKHSDGGYYLITEGSGNPTIYDAGTPDGSGGLAPEPTPHTEIDMGAVTLYIMIVKYSLELTAEWATFITCITPISMTDYTVDPSGNLLLMVVGGFVNISFYNTIPPDGPLTTPILSPNIDILGCITANFSNVGALNWCTRMDISESSALNAMTGHRIRSDNNGGIYILVSTNTGDDSGMGTNNFNIYNNDGLNAPTLSGKFSNAMSSYCIILMKYTPTGQLEWVVKNDTPLSTVLDGTNMVIDKDDNIYINYDVSTPGGGQDQYISSIYAPPTIAGDLFVKVRMIGAISDISMGITGIYQTIIKYNSSGDFQWLSVVASINAINVRTGFNKSILLESGDVLSSFLVNNGTGGTLIIYKKSIAPVPPTPGDDGGNFTLIKDIETPYFTGADGSIMIRQTSNGENIWASMLGMSTYMVGEDPMGNLYCSGTITGNDPGFIYNAGTSQTAMTLAGNIPQYSKSRGLTVALTSAGIIEWVHLISDTVEPIDRDVSIDVSTSNIILSANYHHLVESLVTFSNRISPIGNGQFEPVDYAGSLNSSEYYETFLVKIGGISTKVVNPSYNLLYPNNNNKTIINNTTSDAVIYGRGLLINMGNKVYEAVLGPGAVISLLSIANGCYDGRWIVVETYGDVKFA